MRQDISVLAEQHVQFLKNAGHNKKSQSNTRRWYTDNFIDPLCGVSNKAQKSAELYPPDNNPRLRYEFQVLSVWTKLGGDLRISRHPKSGKVQLARFFRAVTVPVMGISAPSPESLPDIVRRQKRFVAF
jgi:hypothetical protein